MLRVMGKSNTACDGLSRREVIRVGGLSLFGGLTLPAFLQAAKSAGGARRPGTAKSVILLNLFGGPPHMDMFDLKPAAPANVRGEFKPIDSAVSGVQICDALPCLSVEQPSSTRGVSPGMKNVCAPVGLFRSIRKSARLR